MPWSVTRLDSKSKQILSESAFAYFFSLQTSLAVLNPECNQNETSFFCLFTLIFLIPSLKVCCTSQLAVNWSMDNIWDTRLSKYPMVRKARLKPTWWPQGLSASKVHQQWIGEGEWDWTMSQSSEPDAEVCSLETPCPAKAASHVQASSWTLVTSVGSWHQPLRPHMTTCIRPDLSI